MTIPRIDGWWDEIKEPVGQIKDFVNRDVDRERAVQDGILSGKIDPQVLANMAAKAPEFFARLKLGKTGQGISAMGESAASKRDRILDDATLEALKNPQTRGEAVAKLIGTKTDNERKIEEQGITRNDQLIKIGDKELTLKDFEVAGKRAEEEKRTRLEPIVQGLSTRKLEKDVQDFIDQKLDNGIAEAYQYSPEYSELWKQMIMLEKQERMNVSAEGRAKIRAVNDPAQRMELVRQLNAKADNDRQALENAKNFLNALKIEASDDALAKPKKKSDGSEETAAEAAARFSRDWPEKAAKIEQRRQIMATIPILQKRYDISSKQLQYVIETYLPDAAKGSAITGETAPPANTQSAPPPATPASRPGEAPAQKTDKDKQKKQADRYEELKRQHPDWDSKKLQAQVLKEIP